MPAGFHFIAVTRGLSGIMEASRHVGPSTICLRVLSSAHPFGGEVRRLPVAGLEGTNVGPYEIKVLLGAGGMGQVYRARDPRLEREVAIKVLSASLAADPAALARFEREAMSGAK